MIILAIETSCDETGVAIVESRGVFDHTIIVNLVASQITIHAPYGGIVPRLAAREHEKNLPILAKKVLKTYKGRVDVIAYTHNPGLEPALLVGRIFAKTLGYALSIPVFPVNHLYGHIFASFAKQTYNLRSTTYDLFPAIGLVISGGHTQLYKFSSFQKIELLGETIDDALGEALDKGARCLGLPYPGGPHIEKFAKKGEKGVFIFPSPMVNAKNLNFSFSGLKTALLYKSNELKTKGELSFQIKADLARAYQSAAFKAIREKTKKALKEEGARSLFVGGGVVANDTLREDLQFLISSEFPHTRFFVPEKQFCTDNAAMIALAHAIPTIARIKNIE